MKVKKKCINIERTRVDIVLCPKTKLYLQNLYCTRCAYFISDEENYISCRYEQDHMSSTDKEREKLIKLFSKINEKSEISSNQSVNIEDDEFLRNRELLKTELIREIEILKSNRLRT